METYPSLVQDSVYGTIGGGTLDDRGKAAGPIAYGFAAADKREARVSKVLSKVNDAKGTVRLPGINEPSIDQKELLQMGECIYSDESARRSKKHSKVALKKFTFGEEPGPRSLTVAGGNAQRGPVDHSVPAIERNKSVNVAEMVIEEI